jgi:large subunit ribosomal protein L22
MPITHYDINKGQGRHPWLSVAVALSGNPSFDTMEVQAITRYARMSPKKVREVARTIQGRKAPDAVDLLGIIPRKSARLIVKTLKSAIANAENNNNLSADSLIVKSAIVDQGPVLKRFKAGARGTAMPRRKKMSHITIVLTDGNTN